MDIITYPCWGHSWFSIRTAGAYLWNSLPVYVKCQYSPPLQKIRKDLPTWWKVTVRKGSCVVLSFEWYMVDSLVMIMICELYSLSALYMLWQYATQLFPIKLVARQCRHYIMSWKCHSFKCLHYCVMWLLGRCILVTWWFKTRSISFNVIIKWAGPISPNGLQSCCLVYVYFFVNYNKTFLTLTLTLMIKNIYIYDNVVLHI